MASPEQLHKPCLCAAGSAGFQKYLMGACKPKLKEFFWKNVFKSWLGTVELVLVRTGFEPPQLRWTLNWTLGPVQQKCWTLNWTSVRFSKVQVWTSVLDRTSATLGISGNLRNFGRNTFANLFVSNCHVTISKPCDRIATKLRWLIHRGNPIITV